MSTSVGGCTHVVLLGLRGTFEPFDVARRGLGPTLDGFATRLEAAVCRGHSDVAFAAHGVRYPATALAYGRSRTGGARELVVAARSTVHRLPECSLVLAGLSQGADAVRRALAEDSFATLVPRVGAVILFGDPTRRPDDGAVHDGPNDHPPGVLARWATPIPDSLRAKTWSGYLENDRVAANTHGVSGIFRSGSHTHYEANASGVLDRAVQFVVLSLGLPLHG